MYRDGEGLGLIKQSLKNTGEPNFVPLIMMKLYQLLRKLIGFNEISSPKHSSLILILLLSSKFLCFLFFRQICLHLVSCCDVMYWKIYFRGKRMK